MLQISATPQVPEWMQRAAMQAARQHALQMATRQAMQSLDPMEGMQQQAVEYGAPKAGAALGRFTAQNLFSRTAPVQQMAQQGVGQAAQQGLMHSLRSAAGATLPYLGLAQFGMKVAGDIESGGRYGAVADDIAALPSDMQGHYRRELARRALDQGQIQGSQGAFSGFVAGSPFGPVGMAVGAIGGGLSGQFSQLRGAQQAGVGREMQQQAVRGGRGALTAIQLQRLLGFSPTTRKAAGGALKRFLPGANQLSEVTGLL